MPATADRRPRRARALVVLPVALVAAAVALAGRPAHGPPQPLPFDHRVHVAAKVDCLQCHAGVLDAEEPRLPPLDVCAGCHKDPPGANAGKAALARAVAAGRPLAWRSTFRLPGDVFFSHARHVDVAELACERCHGPTVRGETSATQERSMAMSTCIGCHAHSPDNRAARRATLDCASCHR